MIIRALRYSFFFLICLKAFAQGSLLDRPVTVKMSNVRLNEALNEISQKADFSYSANAKLFDVDRRIDLIAINKPVRQVLDQLFKGTVRYKVRGNHLILLKAPPPEGNLPEVPKNVFISGYITNAQTGEKIAEASVYDRTTLASAVSNDFGYYQIKLPAHLSAVRLQVSKQNYFSENLTIKTTQDDNLNVSLRPQPTIEELQPVEAKPLDTNAPVTDVEVKAPDVDVNHRRKFNQYTVLNWLLSAKQAIHLQNIKDTLYRPFQISLLPFLGTNHVLSGQVTNDVSYNIIAGYSAGVNVFEVGGIANFVREHVTGVQFAGVTNMVGGHLDGFQFAGVSNHAFGSSQGFQFAGIVNTLWKSSQVSQFAGVVNFSTRDLHGLQLSGGANFTFGTHRGMQFAAVYNFANELRGTQLSLFNVAGKVHSGRQIGLLNVADSSARTPLGFFSFVRQNGYRRFELSTNEFNYANVTFKTGVRKFYNIFTAGFSPSDSLNNWLWSYGYGIGTAVNLNRRQTSQLSFDFIVNTVNVGKQRNFNQLNKFQFIFEQKLGRHIAFAFGPTFNFFATLSERPENQVVSKQITRFLFLNETYRSGWSIKGWMGYSAGLRLVI